MNKPIFRKIKKAHLESITQSPGSQQDIQHMTVHEMQQNLLSQMSQSRSSSPTKYIINSNNEFSEGFSISDSKFSKNIQIESKKIPELMLQNDKLKFQIERLKSEKKLILSQYQHVQTQNKVPEDYVNTSKEKSRQFSFRKSMENIQKMVSLQKSQNNEKFSRQNMRSRQSGSINERSIPCSDSRRNQRISGQKRLGTSQSSKIVSSGHRKSGSKQIFSTLEERFYQYCKSEMVRMNTQNTKLSLKIGQLQNKLTSLHKQYEYLEQENANLKSMNESLQVKLKAQNQRIETITGQMSVSLSKKDEIVSSQFKMLRDQLNQLRIQQENLRKSLHQKDVQIASLKAQNLKKQSDSKNYAQMVVKNASLQNQINQLIIRNKRLSDKFRRMPIIDHLWQIKEVEYDNLINLIAKEKQLCSNKQFKNMPLENSSNNGFDLTFSKDKSRYKS